MDTSTAGRFYEAQGAGWNCGHEHETLTGAIACATAPREPQDWGVDGVPPAGLCIRDQSGAVQVSAWTLRSWKRPRAARVRLVGGPFDGSFATTAPEYWVPLFIVDPAHADRAHVYHPMFDETAHYRGAELFHVAFAEVV